MRIIQKFRFKGNGSHKTVYKAADYRAPTSAPKPEEYFGKDEGVTSVVNATGPIGTDVAVKTFFLNRRPKLNVLEVTQDALGSVPMLLTIDLAKMTQARVRDVRAC